MEKPVKIQLFHTENRELLLQLKFALSVGKVYIKIVKKTESKIKTSILKERLKTYKINRRNRFLGKKCEVIALHNNWVVECKDDFGHSFFCIEEVNRRFGIEIKNI